MFAVGIDGSTVQHCEHHGAYIEVEHLATLIARHLEAMASYYPADVFTPEGRTPDGIAGTALRTVLLAEASRLRGERQ